MRGYLLLLVIASGSASLAQDSVSRNANGGNGLPGDALNPFGAGAGQRSNYVLDLSPIFTSRGTGLGVGPVIKTSRLTSNATNFGGVHGPTVISSDIRTGQLPYTNSYALWSTPGAGINTSENLSASLTTAPSSTARLGLAMLAFDEQPVGSSLGFVNQVITALVSFDPAVPDRLYVTRFNAAINSPSLSGDRSQFGLGGVDADGVVSLRADGFGVLSTTSPMLGDNLFKVRSLQRGTGLNLIDNVGGSDVTATSRPGNQLASLAAAPSIVPSSLIAGGRVVSADFVGSLLIENGAGALVNVSDHRPSTIDHRGGPSVHAISLFPGSVATVAMHTRTNTGGGLVEGISVMGLAADASPAGQRTLALPSSLLDACDAFAWPLTFADFRLYDSQAIFRGGSGPAAVGTSLDGSALVAGTVSVGGNASPAHSINAIAVARFDASQPASTPVWSLAAWVAQDGLSGKEITGDFGADGAPNTNDAGEGDGVLNALDAPVGRIQSLNNTPGGLVGPSLSAPAFDSAGNVYFLASTLLRVRNGPTIQDEPRVALLRAIPRTPAQGGTCYDLEIMLAEGRVVQGRNSSRNYRIESLTLSDGDSLASASLWSGNVNSQPFAGLNAGTLPQHAPQHLGGLTIGARIVYDADNDGDFADPTAIDADQSSRDEASSVALLIANVTPVSACGSIDFNGDGLFPDDADLVDFLSVFAGGACSTGTCGSIDFNGDGLFPDDADVASFLSVLAGGPC